MPLRYMNRDQGMLMPPDLDEWVAQDHPVRFVAAFVDELDRADWEALEIDPDGAAIGSPAYAPRVLLAAWLYGFMSGVRSSRRLEEACRDQIPFAWLLGQQCPDHNTLWRFYKNHRHAMRGLLTRTVVAAVRSKLVDLALQAVDGTKMHANASGDRTLDAAGLKRLLVRLGAAVDALEAQNEGSEDASPVHLPAELAEKEALRERVRSAMEKLAGSEELERINLTDEDARLMKSRQGIVPAYNAQAMVSPVVRADGSGGMVITAAEVVTAPNDFGQLEPMMERAEEATEVRSAMTLADAGYHSGRNVETYEERGQRVAMPESQDRALRGRYHKDRFIYDAERDSYLCPEGRRLRFTRTKRTRGTLMKLYRGSGSVCRACPAFGVCTKDGRHGRALEIGPHDDALKRHRAWMSTDEAAAAYRRRQGLVEPVFGIIKEQHGGRRFLLRGLGNVSAEWSLLATAFNLKTLWRAWKAGLGRGEQPRLASSVDLAA